MKQITILGATGSIGQSTLDVLRRHPGHYQVFALTAARSIDSLYQLCLEHQPQYAVLLEEHDASQLAQRLLQAGCKTQVLQGEEALCQVASASEVDLVMAAIVGGAGLMPTMAAVRAGKRVLLANKEALVMSGALFIDAVEQYGAELLPIDSEHNAIYQAMPAEVQQQLGRADLEACGVHKILLTGSGGPFRYTPLEQLAEMTPAQACAHPNWSMGQKISVDSATMMNKGLEFVEAKWLFNARADQIQVVIHPQSVIHSMVSYKDGSVLAQLGQPDMRTPIAHALAYPERIESGVEPLDFFSVGEFSFLKPDFRRYPNLELAIQACEAGQVACTVLNAANEIAVEAFLEERIGFTDIARINSQILERLAAERASDLESLLELDRMTRQAAYTEINRLRP